MKVEAKEFSDTEDIKTKNPPFRRIFRCFYLAYFEARVFSPSLKRRTKIAIGARLSSSGHLK